MCCALAHSIARRRRWQCARADQICAAEPGIGVQPSIVSGFRELHRSAIWAHPCLIAPPNRIISELRPAEWRSYDRIIFWGKPAPPSGFTAQENDRVQPAAEYGRR